jgi:hypothetical protein
LVILIKCSTWLKTINHFDSKSLVILIKCSIWLKTISHFDSKSLVILIKCSIIYILILLSICDMPFRPVNLRGQFCDPKLTKIRFHPVNLQGRFYNPPVHKNEVLKTRCGWWRRRETENEVPLFIFRYFIY